MKIGFAILLVMTATTGSSVPQPAGIQSVAWLQGCWERVSSERTVEEHWMAPRGNSMIGVSRSVSGDRLTGFELVVIREQGDRLAYEAHPSGQPSAVFLSGNVGAAAVVFENPDHDFPQRIGYQQSTTDSLLGWIEGSRNGEPRRIEFPYRRAVCPGN